MVGVARNWFEELVAEYYEMQGYDVRTDVPLVSVHKTKEDGTAHKGSRFEADAIARKVEGDVIDLLWIEVGGHPIEKLLQKFSSYNEDFIKEHYGEKGHACHIHKIVIFGGISDDSLERFREQLRDEKIETLRLKEFLPMVINDVKGRGYREGTTLPESWHFLKMLEAMIWIWLKQKNVKEWFENTFSKGEKSKEENRERKLSKKHEIQE